MPLKYLGGTGHYQSFYDVLISSRLRNQEYTLSATIGGKEYTFDDRRDYNLRRLQMKGDRFFLEGFDNFNRLYLNKSFAGDTGRMPPTVRKLYLDSFEDFMESMQKNGTHYTVDLESEYPAFTEMKRGLIEKRLPYAKVAARQWDEWMDDMVKLIYVNIFGHNTIELFWYLVDLSEFMDPRAVHPMTLYFTEFVLHNQPLPVELGDTVARGLTPFDLKGIIEPWLQNQSRELVVIMIKAFGRALGFNHSTLDEVQLARFYGDFKHNHVMEALTYDFSKKYALTVFRQEPSLSTVLYGRDKPYSHDREFLIELLRIVGDDWHAKGNILRNVIGNELRNDPVWTEYTGQNPYFQSLLQR